MDKRRSLVLVVLYLILFSLLLNGCNFSNVDTSSGNSLDKVSLKLNYEEITLCIGETIGFIPEFSDGEKYDVTYESDASYVAKIEKNILTAVSLGTTTVKAKAENGEEAVCNITIIDAPKTLSLSRSEIVLFKDEIYELGFIWDNMSVNSHSFEFGDNIDVELQDKKLCVKANELGTGSIKIKTFNGLEADCTVKVVEKGNTASLEGFQTIYQFPELPTGCEVTAATMALRYLGFDIRKCELADLYLPYTFDFTGDVRYKFLGHPRDAKSAGCYAPCIVTTLENYLEAKELSDEWVVENITDSSPETLYDYVSKGIPVIVWVSSSFKEPYVNYWCTGDDGTLIPWMFPEHCAVLVGFDKENGTVDIADSEYGITCVRSLAEFEKIYDMMMKQAIVVYKK